MDKGINVLSLFDGISCGMVALERACIKVNKYDAYEIDKDTIKVSEFNYPDIKHKGDVFKAEYRKGEYDLLIGGSPCTYWSIAKAGNGRETTSSGFGWELFMQYVRALREVQPKYFLYENNFSMSSLIKEEITKQLGVEPVMINSADFSAQERKRYYWTNIPIDLNYEKNELLIKDILYDQKCNIRDFSKYKHTVKWSKNKKVCSWDTSGKGYYSQSSRARTLESKSNTLTASGSRTTNIYLGGFTCREVNEIEMERLQTLPDDYTSCLNSKTKRKKGIGNGWTVDVIVHILKGITIQ